MKTWYNDDNFWEVWAPYLFSAYRMRNAGQEVDQLVSLLKLQPKSTVIDVCCGVGRHALELARRGYDVTGIDRTKSYIQSCREAAYREGLDVSFVLADAFSAHLGNRFDAAISMFTSFGYYDDEFRNVGLVRNLCSSLNPNGSLLVQIVGKEVLARDFREHDVYEHEDGTLGIQKRSVRDGWERLDSEWTLIRSGELLWKGALSYRLYSGSEMKQLLLGAGFHEVGIYGNLAGAPYDNTAQELVAVAVKRT